MAAEDRIAVDEGPGATERTGAPLNGANSAGHDP